MRVICEQCSQPYQAAAHERIWLKEVLGEAADQLALRKGSGCSHCYGSGYQGRTGIYEMMEMTRALAEAASDPDPATLVRAATVQMAGKTLRHDAIRLVGMGQTTLEEAMRISNEILD